MNEQEALKLYNALLGKGYSTDDLGDEQTFLRQMGDAGNRKQLYDWVSGRGDFRIGDYNSYEHRLSGTGSDGEHRNGGGDESYTFTEAQLAAQDSQNQPVKAQPSENGQDVPPPLGDVSELLRDWKGSPKKTQNGILGVVGRMARTAKDKAEKLHADNVMASYQPGQFAQRTQQFGENLRKNRERTAFGLSGTLARGDGRLNTDTGKLERGFITSAGNEFDEKNKVLAEQEQRQINRYGRPVPYSFGTGLDSLGKDIQPMVDEALKKADNRWFSSIGEAMSAPMSEGMELHVLRNANAEVDPDKILQGLRASLEASYQSPEMQQKITELARLAGMPKDRYMREVVAPALTERLEGSFVDSQLRRHMPKDAAEYVLSGIGDSVGGLLIGLSTDTKSQRAYKSQAMAMTDAGENPYYQPGTGAKLAKLGVSFASDAPFFGVYGRVGGSVAKKLAERQVSRIMAKGLSEGAARSIVGTALENSVGARMKNYLMQHMVSSSITLGAYNATSESARQLHDADFDILRIASSTAEGVGTGAAFGLTGGVVHALSQPLSGIAKIGSKAGGFLAEAETMYATEELAKMVHGEEGFTNPFEGSLEAMMKLGVMKASSPGGLLKAGDMLLHPKEILKRQHTGVSFTKEDESYVKGSVGGRNLVEALNRIHPEIATTEIGGRRKLTAEGERQRRELSGRYETFMNDTEIPYTVKVKVARTLGGLVPDAAHTPLEVGSDIVHNADGSVTLKTRDKDGNCMQDVRFDSFSEAEQWREAHEGQFRLNDAVNMWNGSDPKKRVEVLKELMEEYGVGSDEAMSMVKATLNGSMGNDFSNDQFLRIYDSVYNHAFPADEPHVQRSYWDGSNLPPEERHAAMVEALRAERRLQAMDKGFADEVVGAADYPDEKIVELAGRDDVSGEQLQAVIDYYNKAARADGMMDEMLKDVDRQVAEANARIERNTHTGSGQLIEADYRGRSYYVTAGKVEVGTDGVPRVEGTGGVLVIRDRKTGDIEVASPGELRLTSVSDPRRLMAENDSMDGLRGQLMKQADDNVELHPDTPEAPQEMGEVFKGAGGKTYMVTQGPDETGNVVWQKIELDEKGEPKGEPMAFDNDEYRKAKSNEIDEASRPQEEVTEPQPEAEPAAVPPAEAPAANPEPEKTEIEKELEGRLNGGINTAVDDSQQATAASRIPVDEKGRKQYEQAKPEYTLADLTEKHGEEKAQQMISKIAESTAKELEKLQQTDTSGITDMNDLDAHETQIENLKKKLDYWKNLAPKESPSEELRPVSTGILGENYDQFRGNARGAIDFLLEKKSGNAVGALHHKDVGDIDLWYGNENAGLEKIAKKHPEVLNDLQGVLNGMHVVSASENRVVLESDTHKAVVSKMLGNEKTDNWLLSAYEKKGTSASSSDIETEPEGKQNGTAPLQNTSSAGKDTKNTVTNQENQQKNSPEGETVAPQQPAQPPVPPAKAKLYQKTVEANAGRTFTYTDANGVRSELTLQRIDHEGNAVVTRQDYDAKGNRIGEVREERYPFHQVGEAIISGSWKKALDTDEELRQNHKYHNRKVGDVPVIDVLTDSEKLQLLDALRRGDIEAAGRLEGDLINSHRNDLILRGREIRNEKVDRAMSRSGMGERLRSVRRQYEGFSNALSMLEDGAMEPQSIEEYVADALGDVPKAGNGFLAYESYEKGGNEIVGLKDESGFGKRGFSGDTKGFNPWLAPKGQGISLKQFAEKIHESLPEGMKEQFSDQDIRNVINSVMTGAEKPSDISNYILRNRLEQAEAEARHEEDGWMESPSYQKVVSDDSFAGRLERAEQQTETEPTEGQKRAGNYRKGHIRIAGLNISIENPKGSVRRGTDADGKSWEQQMHNTYGYIRGTQGADGDYIDVFLSDDPTRSGKVYIVQQRKKIDGAWEFDELKVLLGFDDAAQASNAYLSNYEKGWKGMHALIETDIDSFKDWLKNGKQEGTYKEDGAWTKIYPGVSDMVADERQMPKPEQQEMEVLRGKGNNRLPGMGGELPEVSGGYGQTAIPESNTGQNRRERELLHGELQVDRLDNPVTEPKDGSLPDVQGQDNVNAAVGRGNGAPAEENKVQNPDVPLGRRQDTGNSRRDQGKLQNDNISGQNNENGGLGERTQSELQNAEKQDKAGLDNGKDSHDTDEHKADGKVKPTDSRESVIRDAVVDHLRSIGVEVSTDWQEGQRILDEYNGNGPIKKMGSRVDSKKKQMSDEIGQRGLTEEQQAVVDVYTGKSDNQPLTVTRDGKELTVRMRQGNEQGAGTKHSLFRHYGTGTGVITADDVIRIPDVLANGERNEKQRGKTRLNVYQLTVEDGIKYTVLTEINNRGKEVFNDFYSNRKASSAARLTAENSTARHIDNVNGHTNTQLSAQADANNASDKTSNQTPQMPNGDTPESARTNDLNASSGAKVQQNPESSKDSGRKFFKTSDGHAYGYTYKGKLYIDPRIATAETPVHEYGHLWCEMKRNTAPEEWNQMKQVMLGDELVQPIIERVRRDYPELAREGKEDDFIEEVITQFSGKRGSERLKEIADEVAAERGGVFGKAEAVTAMQRLKNILNSFWEGVARMMGWKYRNANQIADRMMADMLNGVNPREKVKETSHKQRQLEIVTRENPMHDDYHTGIRKLEDIKTFEEAYDEGKKASEEGGWDEYASYPDITNELIEDARKSGKITVHSSYPIKDGVFVTPSMMQAKDYAGEGRVYSKRVPLEDVAWINLDEGQYAKVSEAPRKQLVGKKGAAEADNSEGSSDRMDSNRIAEEMEKSGKDAKAIKLATGWERGKDGQWRYEIPDADVDIISKFNDKFAEMKADGVESPEPILRLGELLGENNELFKYYPKMKDMPVLFTKGLPNGTAGAYDKGAIELNTRELDRFDVGDLNNENVYGTLLHEVQHAIQDIEGFAKGGSLMTSTTEEGISAIIVKKERQRADIKTKLDANRRILDDPEELKSAAELDGKPVNEVKEQLEETVGQQAAEYDNLTAQIERIKKLKTVNMSDARDLYHRLAGEVESRNVTERMGMTDEQRRQSPASETEDLARDDQVVIMGDGRAMSISDIKPVGKGDFGDIYDQFKGKPKEAVDFLVKKKKGDLLGVFHRDEVGDIDLVWGESHNSYKGKGLAHIIKKHINMLHDFRNTDELSSVLDDVVNNGEVGQNGNNIEITKDGYRVVLAQEGNGKKWVLTAFDNSKTKKEKLSSANTPGTPIDTSGSRAVAADDNTSSEAKNSTLDNTTDTDKTSDRGKRNDTATPQSTVSAGKDTKNIGTLQENQEENAFEAPKFQRVGSPEPEMTPEERQYWNKWDAAMRKWKERNAIPEDQTAAPEKPRYRHGESALDYAKRLVDWNREKSLWQTAPRLEDYRQVRSDKDAIEAARENEQRYPDSPSARMRRAASEFQRVRHAMSRQKAYDKATVKAVTDFAQDFMKMGFGDNLTRGEMERMLSSVKNATGAKDIRKEVDNIMNILADSYLRDLEQQVVKLSSTKELSKTAQGVEKQGRLELKGQRMIQAFREAREGRMDAVKIRERMAVVAERMNRSDDEAPMWEQEYEGLSIALQYEENIGGSRTEWADLDREYKDAVAEYKNSGRSYKEQQELLESLEQAMQENKIERIGLYGDIIGRLQGNISESMKGAGEFVEREKQRQKRIWDMTNFDLAGKEMGAMREKVKGKPANFFMLPLGTFEQMLRLFGSRNASGEGYLYNHFMRGWMDATDNAYIGEEKAKSELDQKAREVFGGKVKRWSDLYTLERGLPTMEVEMLDGGERKTFTLTQGNLLYIYMADKMTDGRMKLRKMGIDEKKVETIRDFLDPRIRQLGDWLQDEYLPGKRTVYNKVHERMFGAPMAAIDSYFPLKVLGDARYQEQDVNVPDGETLPSTITGNIIKRTKNALPLDVLHTDALSLAIEHIEDMEHWAAQAEWNKDVNTLLSYTTFRNKVKNMKTVYGSGDALWNAFKDAAKMAAGTYDTGAKSGHVDKAISNIAKGVTAAKINFRVYTAFKQILSAPAFLHDVNLADFVHDGVNPYGSWKWAMENMPVFRKRWESRQVGDTRLMDDATDWKMWKNGLVKKATMWGMSPNALVDGITCAVGARSIYKSRYKKYKEIGASDEVAHKRALQDAEIGYNLTQQSSEGAFVSTIQMDRTVAANMLSVFRNSSFAYTRQWWDASRNLKRRMQKGYREDSIKFMTGQIQKEFGLDETQARKAAEAEYARAGRRDVARMLNMMFVVTVAWNLGASLPYLLLGDDNETKKEMMTDALLKGLLAGPTEGFATGNIISDFVGVATDEGVRNAFRDEGLWGGFKQSMKNMGEHDVNPLPLFADMERMIGKMKSDEWAAAQDVFNICVQSAVGVNPQTFTDMWNAVMDYAAPGWDGTSYTFDKENMANAKEIALFMMRFFNAPVSSWRNKYIDELGMNAEDAKKLPYEEMARRYAHYKHWKDAPIMGWFRSEEGREEKMEKIRKQFDNAVVERMARLDDGELLDNFGRSGSREERRLLAKVIASRVLGSDSEGKKATTDWQRAYQDWRTYEDVRDGALLQRMKGEARERGATELLKAVGRKEKEMTRLKKELLKGPDAGETYMVRIRQLRREAMEILMKAGAESGQ